MNENQPTTGTPVELPFLRHWADSTDERLEHSLQSAETASVAVADEIPHAPTALAVGAQESDATDADYNVPDVHSSPLSALSVHTAEGASDDIVKGGGIPAFLLPLLRAAASGCIPRGMIRVAEGLVPDLGAYVCSWATAFHFGDKREALKRLKNADVAWRNSGNR